MRSPRLRTRTNDWIRLWDQIERKWSVARRDNILAALTDRHPQIDCHEELRRCTLELFVELDKQFRRAREINQWMVDGSGPRILESDPTAIRPLEEINYCVDWLKEHSDPFETWVSEQPGRRN